MCLNLLFNKKPFLVGVVFIQITLKLKINIEIHLNVKINITNNIIYIILIRVKFNKLP